MHVWRQAAQSGVNKFGVGRIITSASSCHRKASLQCRPISFHPSAPLTERFQLISMPEPQRHPLEESNTTVGYMAGITAFSSSRHGVLLHSTYRHQSFERLKFYLSMIGLDSEGKLCFAKIGDDFTKYLAVNRNKVRVPIEENSCALVLLSADSKYIHIWYPS